MSQATVKDVGANDFIKSYAALLKRSGKVRSWSRRLLPYMFSDFSKAYATWLSVRTLAFVTKESFTLVIPYRLEQWFMRRRELCSTMW
jgi:hypothetical protein